MSMLPPKSKIVWFINEDMGIMYQFLLKNQHLEQCRYITGEHGSYEKFLMALYWGMNKDIPRHDDLLMDVLTQLYAMQRQLTEVKSIVKRLENGKQ